MSNSKLYEKFGSILLFRVIMREKVGMARMGSADKT